MKSSSERTGSGSSFSSIRTSDCNRSLSGQSNETPYQATPACSRALKNFSATSTVGRRTGKVGRVLAFSGISRTRRFGSNTSPRWAGDCRSWVSSSHHRRRAASDAAVTNPAVLAVVPVPELDVVARVLQNVLELGGVHLADRLGRNAHDEPARRHDLAGRHQRPGADLGALLDDRAVQDDRADADAHIVHDPAGVDDGAMANGDEVTDDAREL